MYSALNTISKGTFRPFKRKTFTRKLVFQIVYCLLFIYGYTEVLEKVLEITPSSMNAERLTLHNILAIDDNWLVIEK